MRIGRTDCAYFFTERAACEYYRNYSGMSSAQLCEVQILETYDRFYRGHALARRHRRAYGHGPRHSRRSRALLAEEMSADPLPEVLFQGRYRLTPVP